MVCKKCDNAMLGGFFVYFKMCLSLNLLCDFKIRPVLIGVFYFFFSLFVCAKRININTLKEILTTLGIVV